MDADGLEVDNNIYIYFSIITTRVQEFYITYFYRFYSKSLFDVSFFSQQINKNDKKHL